MPRFVQLLPCLAALALASGAWGQAKPPIARPGGDGQARTLESFAQALGVSLGGPDDGAVFAAANKAIAATAHSGGLAVALPMGRVERTSIGLVLDNNGGYFCPAPGQCTVQAVRAPGNAEATWMVSVADPYATNLVLSGITFYGGWSPGRGEGDPWLDKQGGVNITHAFAGVKDEAFIANSTIKAQLPLDHVENLVIAGFGGDCLRVQGAGQNTYHNIRGSSCGGHGVAINSYDNKFTDIDFGATGRSCLYMDDQGATNFVQGKAWYCGFRLKPQDDVGLKNTSSGNVFDVTVQDTYGDAILDAGRLSIVTASISWQGVLAPMDAGPISAYSCLGCEHDIVTLNAAVFETNQKFPAVTRLYRDLPKDGRGGSSNTVTIVARGFPQDYGGWQASWLEGPIDASNRITINGIDRAHGNQPDGSGQLAYAIPMNGSATGLVAFGPASGSPGKVALLCQAPQASACTLQGVRSDAGPARSILTALANFAAGETVSIGAATYTFDAQLQPLPGHVRLGADKDASLTALARAINATGDGAGTDYAAATPPNPQVHARTGLEDVIATAAPGAEGNAITVSTTAAHAFWDGKTLVGGWATPPAYSSALTWDRDGHPGMPNLPGPYRNDAAATRAGLPMGGLYVDRRSVVHVLRAHRPRRTKPKTPR